MNLSKTQTTVQVRRTLVRHWIDLDKLSILPVRDTVVVSGELHINRPDAKSEAVGSILSILEEELRRCHGVKRVRFDLENYTRDDLGNWIALEEDSDADPQSPNSDPS